MDAARRGDLLQVEERVSLCSFQRFVVPFLAERLAVLEPPLESCCSSLFCRQREQLDSLSVELIPRGSRRETERKGFVELATGTTRREGYDCDERGTNETRGTTC